MICFRLVSPPKRASDGSGLPSFAQPVQPTDRACPVPSPRFGVLARELAHQTFAVFGHKALDRFRAHGWPVSSTPNLLRNMGPIGCEFIVAGTLRVPSATEKSFEF